MWGREHVILMSDSASPESLKLALRGDSAGKILYFFSLSFFVVVFGQFALLNIKTPGNKIWPNLHRKVLIVRIQCYSVDLCSATSRVFFKCIFLTLWRHVHLE